MMCQRHAHATVDGTARAVPSASVHASSEVRPVTTGSIPVCQSTAPRIAAPAMTPRSLHGGPLIAPPPRRTPATRSAVSGQPRRSARRRPAASRSPWRRPGSVSQCLNESRQRGDVAGRQQQPRASPVGSRRRAPRGPRPRAGPAPAAPAPTPRSRPSRRSRARLASTSRSASAYDASSWRPVRGPASTNRSSRPAERMSRNRSSTNSGAFVRAPTQTPDR